MLAELMLGQLSAAEAVRSWALLCRHRAVALREEASGQLQRATRYMHLRDEVTSPRLAHPSTATTMPSSCASYTFDVQIILCDSTVPNRT